MKKLAYVVLLVASYIYGDHKATQRANAHLKNVRTLHKRELFAVKTAAFRRGVLSVPPVARPQQHDPQRFTVPLHNQN